MLFDSRLGPYDLNSLQVFWDGFRWRLLRPHTVYRTSHWDGDMHGPGAGGRVESLANHVPETEGGTIS